MGNVVSLMDKRNRVLGNNEGCMVAKNNPELYVSVMKSLVANTNFSKDTLHIKSLGGEVVELYRGTVGNRVDYRALYQPSGRVEDSFDAIVGAIILLEPKKVYVWEGDKMYPTLLAILQQLFKGILRVIPQGNSFKVEWA